MWIFLTKWRWELRVNFKSSQKLPRTKIPNQTRHAPTSKTSHVQIIKMMPKKESRRFTCMNELMTNTGTLSLAYHNVFFQVQIYNLRRIMVFTYDHFYSTSFTWKKKNMLQHVFDSCQYFTKKEYFHNNQSDDKWISFLVTSVNKSHDRSLFNTDIPVGWALLLSAMMIQLSVASCQPGLRQSLLQLSAPSAHRATEWAGWGSHTERYGNYSAGQTALKWEQTAFCKRLRVMKRAEKSLQ